MADHRTQVAGQQNPRSPSFFAWFPWEKILIWGLFLLAVYVLRHFFFTIFMTFLVSYIMANIVKRAMKVLSPDTHRIWLQRGIGLIAFVFLIAFLSGVGYFLYHPLKEQATGLYNRVSTASVNVDTLFNDLLRQTIGAWRYNSVYGGKEGEEKKKQDLEEYKKKHYSDYENFRQQADRIEEQFQQKVIADEGQKKYRELEGKGDIDLRVWMFENFASDYFQKNRDELIKQWEEENNPRTEWYFNKFHKQPPEGYFESQDFQIDRAQEIKGVIVTSELQNDRQKHVDEFQIYLGKREYERLKQDEGRFEERFHAFYETLPAQLKPSFDYPLFKKLATLDKNAFNAALMSEETPEDREKRIEKEFRLYKETEFMGASIKNMEYLQIDNVKKWLAQKVPDVTKVVGGLGLYLVNLLIQFGFSLLLSFFITFDLFKIRRGIHKLENSPVRDFYREIAPGLISFGRLIGRAFQAQGVIAICNTMLTLLAMKALGIQNEVFLSAIVFICSFIPILGVVISSVPIAVMAILQGKGYGWFGIVENGYVLALLAIGAIVVVHFIETSILNPKILGDMLHLHPVMVLGILAVGEYFFGIWGLLLGVPVAVYIIRYVILGEDMNLLPEGAIRSPKTAKFKPPKFDDDTSRGQEDSFSEPVAAGREEK